MEPYQNKDVLSKTKIVAHIVNAPWTVTTGRFNRNVLVLVEVDASITAAEQFTVFTPCTSQRLTTFPSLSIKCQHAVNNNNNNNNNKSNKNNKIKKI